MAEVIKAEGNKAYTQVFENTRGLKTGAAAEFTGHMPVSYTHLDVYKRQGLSRCSPRSRSPKP